MGATHRRLRPYVALLLAVAAGEANSDVKAARRGGGGVHGSAVDGRDRGDQGEAETEAIVAGSVVEARKRQEQPVHLVGWHQYQAGVDETRTTDAPLSVAVVIAIVPPAML